MKTILASTYAVNPYKGSEDAMGWNYVLQLARFHKVIAITRVNNEEHILKYKQENPSHIYDNITFIYFDLPYWLRFWKRKSRGALLYFYLWQRAIVPFIKKQKLEFDFVHNLNFHNDWTPSFLWKLNKPFIWGPIGHHPAIPKTFKKNYSYRQRVEESLKNLVKMYFWKYSPTLKNTIKNAEHILCMNGSVEKVIDLKDKSISIAPSVATQDLGWKKRKTDNKFSVISAGRFINLKGFDLTINAFGDFISKLTDKEKSNCELTLVGQGPQQVYIENLIQEMGIEKYVRIIPWMERPALLGLMQDATGFIFPSHEGAGMVIPEALSFGLPCIVLDNWGPGQFITKECGIKVSTKDYNSTVIGLSKAIFSLFSQPDKRYALSVGARQRFLSTFHWDRKGEQLRNIYNDLSYTA